VTFAAAESCWRQLCCQYRRSVVDEASWCEMERGQAQAEE